MRCAPNQFQFARLVNLNTCCRPPKYCRWVAKVIALTRLQCIRRGARYIRLAQHLRHESNLPATAFALMVGCRKLLQRVLKTGESGRFYLSLAPHRLPILISGPMHFFVVSPFERSGLGRGQSLGHMRHRICLVHLLPHGPYCRGRG